MNGPESRESIESGERLPEPRTSSACEASIDWVAAFEAVQGDRAFLRELIDIFLSEYPPLLARIRESLRHGDIDTVSRTAHTLKGSLLLFGNTFAADQAHRLECLTTAVAPEAAQAEFAELERSLDAVKRAIRSFVP